MIKFLEPRNPSHVRPQEGVKHVSSSTRIAYALFLHLSICFLPFFKPPCRTADTSPYTYNILSFVDANSTTCNLVQLHLGSLTLSFGNFINTFLPLSKALDAIALLRQCEDFFIDSLVFVCLNPSNAVWMSAPRKDFVIIHPTPLALSLVLTIPPLVSSELVAIRLHLNRGKAELGESPPYHGNQIFGLQRLLALTLSCSHSSSNSGRRRTDYSTAWVLPSVTL